MQTTWLPRSCVYAGLYNLPIKAVLRRLSFLKSCCEVCHRWEAGRFVCLPQLFFLSQPLLSTLFIPGFHQPSGGKLSAPYARPNLLVCFWLGLFNLPLNGRCRNNGHITCFLHLWGVRKMFPVLTVFHLRSM